MSKIVNFLLSNPCQTLNIVLLILLVCMVANVLRRQSKIQTILKRLNLTVESTYTGIAQPVEDPK